MSKKGKKFDLTHFVHSGDLKDGQVLFFVSDPTKSCRVTKHPSGEFKVVVGTDKMMTVHQFATECLGMEPPVHATKWLRTETGVTLYDVWQGNQEQEAA